MAGKNDFHITDADKEWVHASFEWLVKSYGYPKPGFTPVLLTEQFFPLTLAHKKNAVEPLLADLCALFKIDPTKISFQIEKDITDTYGTPYEIHGEPFECDLEVIQQDGENHYKLFFANALLKTPKRLVFNAVFQFIQIRLGQSDINWIGDEEHYFLFYLIGIYTGWGVILAQTMIDIGRKSDGFWIRRWKYISPMPIPVMAYGMALHSFMIEEKEPAWKNFLPPDIRVQYEKACDHISQDPNPVFNKQELNANILFKEASQQAKEKNLDSAIETYQKAIFLTQDDHLKSSIYHNIGYTLECKGDFEKSIPFFQKALAINPKVGYANENLSFAFIMMGDTDTGIYYHSIASQTGKSVKAYSYRNLAMYHQKRGEIEKARQNFQKAFEYITIPVDWLEYLYARFLYELGEKEEALLYLQMAVEKGEPQAIQWMKEIDKPV